LISKGEPIVVLLVEDEPAHAEIVRRNLSGFRMANRLIHVSDGQAALDYLNQVGEFSDAALHPRPNLVLLDLRLPKVDGLEVLKIIKTSPHLNHIPVVVLTTSKTETDMVSAYEFHANSYLVKPVDHIQFQGLMDSFGFYWLAWNQYPY
jgi:CheY-like chemotaxis protein